MSDGLDEGYSSVESKNVKYAIFAKIKGIEVVRNTNELQFSYIAFYPFSSASCEKL